MGGDFKAGAVLDWDDFRFDDGEQRDKLLIVLGAKQGHEVLLVLTTSKQHHRARNPGCHGVAGYYHAPKGSTKCFSKDTWVILKRPRRASAAELVRLSIEKKVRVMCNLDEQTTSAIKNCLRKGLDVSRTDLDLL